MTDESLEPHKAEIDQLKAENERQRQDIKALVEALEETRAAHEQTCLMLGRPDIERSFIHKHSVVFSESAHTLIEYIIQRYGLLI